MIGVTIRGIATTEAGYVVLLQSEADDKTLPIAIGSAEAQAIAFELKGKEFPRPLTHDLLRNVLVELGATLTKVEVNGLREDTFLATLHLSTPKGHVEVDSRPSDALALALRCEAPMYVAEEVMAKAGVVLDKAGRVSVTRHEEPPDPLQQIKAQLEKAIAEERYEEAARLRDKLRELSGP
jgi:bifunctional DNase/RNase